MGPCGGGVAKTCLLLEETAFQDISSLIWLKLGHYFKQELLNCLQNWLIFATKTSTLSVLYSQMGKHVNTQWDETELADNPSLQLKETWLIFFCFNLLHFLNHFLNRPINTELWHYLKKTPLRKMLTLNLMLIMKPEDVFIYCCKQHNTLLINFLTFSF